MSFPNIPNVTPSITITREQTISLLLASIAFEELGLAHIINAEAEKLQFVLGTLGAAPPLGVTVDDLLDANESALRTLRTVLKKEMLLGFKLEDIIDLIGEIPCEPMIQMAITPGIDACTFNVTGTVTCSGVPVSSGSVALTAAITTGTGSVTVIPGAAPILNGAFSATLTAIPGTAGTAMVTGETTVNGITVATSATTNVACPAPPLCPETATLPNGATIRFTGLTNGGLTWNYEFDSPVTINALGLIFPCAATNFVSCTTTGAAPCSVQQFFGICGTFGNPGVYFPMFTQDGTFSFTLNQVFPVGTINGMAQIDSNFECYSICGPICG